MKRLTTFQNALYRTGATLMLAGAVVFLWWHVASCILYVVGVVLFAAMQISASYTGDDFTVQRLRRQQLFGLFCLLASAVAMSLLTWDLHRGSFSFRYVHHNEWVLLLAIGALMQLYTSFRIPRELGKDLKA